MARRLDLRPPRYLEPDLPQEGSEAPEEPRGVGSRLRQASGDLVLAVFAIALSLILWLIVTSEQNPPIEGLYPYEVAVRPVNVRSGLDVFGDLATVRVRISAPRDSWSRLRVDAFDAKVDMSQRAAGRGEVPVRVDVRDPQVTVLEVSPQQLPVWLEIRKERLVPVRVEIRDAPPEGYSYRTPQSVITRVAVSGPASLVDEIEAVVAEVSVDGARVTINQQVPLVARSIQGTRVTNVRIEPSMTTVEVPIDQQVQYKAVPVHPVVRGEVSPGFWVEAIRSDPAIVVVVGTRDALQAISFVQTGPIEVRDMRQTVSRTVPLVLPEGVSAAAQTTVTVQVAVAAIDGAKSFTVPPVLRGVAPNLTYSAGEVTVVLSGPTPTLARLGPGDIVATIDTSGMVSGTSNITPTVVVPPGTRVVRVTPERVTVQAREVVRETVPSGG